MKRKLIPPFLMLFVGAIVSILMFMLDYETKTMMIVLLLVLISFYIIGCLLKWMLDSFDKHNKEQEAANEGVETSEEEAVEEEIEKK